MLLCGCSASEKQVISSRYGVCIEMPSGGSYSDYKQQIDYDTGVLELNSVVIDVMIGGHPRFSQSVKRKGKGAIHEFQFLGFERSDGQDKLLHAYDRQDRRGPVFVMFSGPDLSAVRKSLSDARLIRNCLQNQKEEQP